MFVARGARAAGHLQGLARARGVPVQFVDREVLDSWCGGTNHQGIACVCAAVQYYPFENLLNDCRENLRAGRRPIVVVLDQVQDPGNLGAILRSADAAGVDGVVVPARRACPITAAVEKASAGAAGHVKISRVVNLTRALEQLKKAGLWTVGLSASGSVRIWQVDLTVPVALVLGGEDAGIRPLVERSCDRMASIPMAGHAGSLNVSAACAVALYEVIRQRQGPRVSAKTAKSGDIEGP